MPLPIKWESRKKNDVDICNICLTRKKLTDDHVPPKGAIEVERLELENLFLMFEKESDVVEQHSRVVQGGIKFRTICEECNSKIGRYDIELARFSNTCRSLAKSNIIIPRRSLFFFRPNTIIRALAGHFMSCTLEPDESTFGRDARTIINDINAAIPDYWQVYYWAYPYSETRIAPRMFIMDPFFEQSEPGLSYVLKFFPLAFLMCENSTYTDLDRLSIFKDQSADFATNICPLPRGTRHRRWPEEHSWSPFTVTATTSGPVGGTRARPYRKGRRR